MKSLLKLARRAEDMLRNMAKLTTEETDRLRLYQMAHHLRQLYPDGDPRLAEIEQIFADYPKGGKHLRREIYRYYVDAAADPLPARAFWPRFRKVFRIHECHARIGNTCWPALMFCGASEASPQDNLNATVELIRASFAGYSRGTRVDRAAVYTFFLRIGGELGSREFWRLAKRCANFVDGADSNDSTIIIK